MEVRPIDPENCTGLVRCMHEGEKCSGPLYDLLRHHLCRFHLIVLRQTIERALSEAV